MCIYTLCEYCGDDRKIAWRSERRRRKREKMTTTTTMLLKRHRAPQENEKFKWHIYGHTATYASHWQCGRIGRIKDGSNVRVAVQHMYSIVYILPAGQTAGRCSFCSAAAVTMRKAERAQQVARPTQAGRQAGDAFNACTSEHKYKLVVSQTVKTPSHFP